MMHEEHEIEHYGDEYITSLDAKVPLWLKFTYIVLPIWGVVWFFLYWNGAWGWIDPGHWLELEKAANTTYQTGDIYFNQTPKKKG